MRDKLIRETPVSIIDFETTGLSYKSGARVVEVSIVRIEPGHRPNVILDTLIDPDGPVLCTSIHGITDDDVLGAPRFTEIIGEVVLSLEGSMVAAFNSSFDMSFFQGEASSSRRTAGLRLPPHICLMWMRPLLGLSNRCSLDVACEQHGIRSGTHRAAEDALACSHMWGHYVAAAEKIGCKTWGDLASIGSHKYLSTLAMNPYSREDFEGIGGRLCGTAKKPRLTPICSPFDDCDPLEVNGPEGRSKSKLTYWNTLIDALSDGEINAAEVSTINILKQSMGLTFQDVREIHTRLYAQFLMVCAEDNMVTDDEAIRIRKLRMALSQLGWEP